MRGDDVVAWYVTDAGAAVDVIHRGMGGETVARCGGCGAQTSVAWSDYSEASSLVGADGSDGADQLAGQWAVSHAEACQAAPRPGGGR